MRICSGAGCLRPVEDNVRYCAECKPIAQPTSTSDNESHDHTSGYNAYLDRLRKTNRWHLLRLRVIRAQPLCARCRKAMSTIVDHIVPAQIAVMQAQLTGKYLWPGEGYFLRTNLQGLCRPCHGLKTIEDKAHSGDWPDVIEREGQRQGRVWTF